MAEDEDKTCGVCEQDAPKYKCPHCELRYCSIPCFKKHIETHDTEETVPEPANTVELLKGLSLPQSPESPKELPRDAYQRFIQDPKFAQMFAIFPDLKRQLRRIYHAMVHPNTLLENGVEIEGEDQLTLEAKWGGPEMRKWSQSKANENAVRLLKDLQGREQGVAEFVELMKATQREVEEESEREQTAEVKMDGLVDAVG